MPVRTAWTAAWMRPRARGTAANLRPSGSCSHGRGQPQTVRAPLSIPVNPNAPGRHLVAHHRYRVTLRLWVTYTPTGGQPRSIGTYGLHIQLTHTPEPTS